MCARPLLVLCTLRCPRPDMHGAPQDVTGLSQESKNAADGVPFLRGCPESENKQQLILENSWRVCPCLEKEPEEGPGKRRAPRLFCGALRAFGDLGPRCR